MFDKIRELNKNYKLTYLIGVGSSLAMGIVYLVLSIVNLDILSVAFVVFYFYMAAIRIIPYLKHQDSIRKGLPVEEGDYKCSILIGVLLLFIEAPLTAVLSIRYDNGDPGWPRWMVFIQGVYVLIKLGLALNKIVRVWKYRGPYDLVTCYLSLISALVTLLGLEFTIIHGYSRIAGDQELLARLIVPVLSLVTTIVFLMAVHLIVAGIRKKVGVRR